MNKCIIICAFFIATSVVSAADCSSTFAMILNASADEFITQNESAIKTQWMIQPTRKNIDKDTTALLTVFRYRAQSSTCPIDNKGRLYLKTEYEDCYEDGIKLSAFSYYLPMFWESTGEMELLIKSKLQNHLLGNKTYRTLGNIDNFIECVDYVKPNVLNYVFLKNDLCSINTIISDPFLQYVIVGFMNTNSVSFDRLYSCVKENKSLDDNIKQNILHDLMLSREEFYRYFMLNRINVCQELLKKEIEGVTTFIAFDLLDAAYKAHQSELRRFVNTDSDILLNIQMNKGLLTAANELAGLITKVEKIKDVDLKRYAHLSIHVLLNNIKVDLEGSGTRTGTFHKENPDFPPR